MGKGLGDLQKKVLELMRSDPLSYNTPGKLAFALWGDEAFYEGQRGSYMKGNYQSNLSRALKGLEKRGLVVRVRKGVYYPKGEKERIKMFIGSRIESIRRKMDEMEREHERLQKMYFNL